jgi:hypothetical protein
LHWHDELISTAVVAHLSDELLKKGAFASALDERVSQQFSRSGTLLRLLSQTSRYKFL